MSPKKGGPGPILAGGILILLFGLLPVIFLAAYSNGSASLTSILILLFVPFTPIAIFVYLGILLIVIGTVLLFRKRARLRLQTLG